MAKKELLCALIYLSLSSKVAFGMNSKNWNETLSPEDQKWAQEFKRQTQNRFWQNMRERAGEYFGAEEVENMMKPRPALQIYVSKSMSKSLLAEYAKEASIYGGVLVFRGLPEGSMIKLTELVTEISDEKYKAAMQIDDESFKEYGVYFVPTIVLTKQEILEDFDGDGRTFDKISGNVGVKYALERFAEEGDLASEAEKILGRRK